MSVAFNEVEYDSSETSDDDYVPSGGEQLSEEENSGEEEDLEATIKDNAENKSRKGTKRKAKVTAQSRKRKGGIKLDEEVSAPVEEEDDYNKQLSEQIIKEHEDKKIGDEKKKADDLWSDFMKDVGSPPARQKSASGSGGSSSLAKTAKVTPSTVKKPANIFKDDRAGPKPSKVTVTKEYDFAGEIVKVTKEVDAGSKEAKNVNQTTTCTSSSSTDSIPGIPGVRKSGLGSVLGKIGIKPKISTLEKSKLDWDGYKKKAGIDEELKIHNRGKEGYIERKQFLERTDLRQFELEKNMRLKTSKGGVFSVDS